MLTCPLDPCASKMYLLSTGAISPRKDLVVRCGEKKEKGNVNIRHGGLKWVNTAVNASGNLGKLSMFHGNNSSCAFSLLSSSAGAVSVGGPFPAVWSLINTASTESSETGATSHTPCCKIMSLQREGIIYKGGERHFLSLSPSWMYSNEMSRGGHPNWLDSSQKRERSLHISPAMYMYLTVTSLH